MKNLLPVFFVFALIASAFGQTPDGPANGPVISFPVFSHDFGDITQGDTVKYVFKFKNGGTAPLILQDVMTTCGCTSPSWTKQPVLPGQSGEIAITYNSAGKEGIQNKVITVRSNATNSPARVSIRVNVLPKK